ncbi:MAG: transcriptional repressor [Tannerellaceae bacterium]|jgi:Fur family ferric uptake transcriptional regulator|nr:transcriptional repressor [Tannerellaceae bacterium]
MYSDYEQKLIKWNIKPTSTRLLTLKAISDKKAAVTLAGLEEELQTVDRSTIFRTLVLFEQNHLLHTIDDGSGSLKYALCDEGDQCLPEEQHAHFFCNRCRQTICLRDLSIPSIRLPNNFSAASINYVIKGICCKCKNAAKEEP